MADVSRLTGILCMYSIVMFSADGCTGDTQYLESLGGMFF